jgi:hypothetical protein
MKEVVALAVLLLLLAPIAKRNFLEQNISFRFLDFF